MQGSWKVLNTDAEGRLTLADALVYAEKLEVDTIIDMATLTGQFCYLWFYSLFSSLFSELFAIMAGACIVALGEKLAGLYCADSTLRGEIEGAAKRTDEGVWSLPLEQQYKENIKSSIADIKNLGAKGEILNMHAIPHSFYFAIRLRRWIHHGCSLFTRVCRKNQLGPYWYFFLLFNFVRNILTITYSIPDMAGSKLRNRWLLAHIHSINLHDWCLGPVWDTSGNKPTGFGVKLLVDFLLNAKKKVER